jgi:hypothetical protein
MFRLVLLVFSLVVVTSFGVRKAVLTTFYDSASITPEFIVFSTESITTVVLKFLSAAFIYTVLKY